MNELALFNRLFNDGDFFPKVCEPANVMPNVDVKENENEYVLDMDLPGKTEKDVELNLKDDVLTISSQHEETKEEKSDKKDKTHGEWLIRERRNYNFTRRFTLPQDVNVEGVNASFKNGVLTVVMPRKPVSEPKKIEIKTA
ncbi:MAG: Hsp20/alpha crystallin family protein [Treponema sp.]|nr:Hsp20/alpha crystallin family protein [Treponema sp.]